MRARSGDAAVQPTLPGVIEPGAELVIENESDQPKRVVAEGNSDAQDPRPGSMSPTVRHHNLPVDS
jgi:hypothetical protein